VLRSIDNEYTIPPLKGLQVSGTPYFPDKVNAYLRLAIETDHLYIGMLQSGNTLTRCTITAGLFISIAV
jgi:hypothetical protein